MAVINKRVGGFPGPGGLGCLLEDPATPTRQRQSASGRWPVGDWGGAAALLVSGDRGPRSAARTARGGWRRKLESEERRDQKREAGVGRKRRTEEEGVKGKRHVPFRDAYGCG